MEIIEIGDESITPPDGECDELLSNDTVKADDDDAENIQKHSDNEHPQVWPSFSANFVKYLPFLGRNFIFFTKNQKSIFLSKKVVK